MKKILILLASVILSVSFGCKKEPKSQKVTYIFQPNTTNVDYNIQYRENGIMEMQENITNYWTYTYSTTYYTQLEIKTLIPNGGDCTIKIQVDGATVAAQSGNTQKWIECEYKLNAVY